MRLPPVPTVVLPDLQVRQAPSTIPVSSASATMTSTAAEQSSSAILSSVVASSLSPSSVTSLASPTIAAEASPTISSSSSASGTPTVIASAIVPSSLSITASSAGSGSISASVSSLSASIANATSVTHSSAHPSASSLAEKLENPIPTPRYSPGGMAFILPAFAVIGLIFIIWLIHKTREYIWKLREAEDAADCQSPDPSKGRRGAGPSGAGGTRKGWRKKGWKELESGSEDEKYNRYDRYDEDRRWRQRDEKWGADEKGSVPPAPANGGGWRRQSDKYSKPGDWQGSRKYKSRERRSSKRGQDRYEDERDAQRGREGDSASRTRDREGDRAHRYGDPGAADDRAPNPANTDVARRDSKTRRSAPDAVKPSTRPAPTLAVEPALDVNTAIHVPAWHGVKPGRALSRKERNDRAGDWVRSGSGSGSGAHGRAGRDRDVERDGSRERERERERYRERYRDRESDRDDRRRRREREERSDRAEGQKRSDRAREEGRHSHTRAPPARRSEDVSSEDDSKKRRGKAVSEDGTDHDGKPVSEHSEHESVPDAYEDEFEDRYQTQALVDVAPVASPHPVTAQAGPSANLGAAAMQVGTPSSHQDAPAYMRARATSPPPILSPPMNPTLFFHMGPSTTQLVPLATYDTATDLDSIAPTVITRTTEAQPGHARMPSIPSTAEKLATISGGGQTPVRAKSKGGRTVERTPTRAKSQDVPSTPTGTVRGGRTEALRTPIRRGTTDGDKASGRVTPTIRLIDSRGGSIRDQSTLSKAPGPNKAKKTSTPALIVPKKNNSVKRVVPAASQSTPPSTPTEGGSSTGGADRRVRAERKEQKARGKVDEILRDSWSERAVVSPVNVPAGYDDDDDGEDDHRQRYQHQQGKAVPKDEVEMAHAHAHAESRGQIHVHAHTPEGVRSRATSPTPISPKPVLSPRRPEPEAGTSPQRPLSPRKMVPQSGMSPSLQEAAALQGIEQRLAMLRKMEG